MTRRQISRRDFLTRSAAGVAGFGLLGLAACGDDDDAAAPVTTGPGGAGPEQVFFILDWIPKGQTAPFYLALDKGYYAEEGISLQLARGYGSGDTSARIGRGEGDFGFAGVSAVMNTISQGLPLREIAAIAHTHPTSVYGAPGAGIITPDDLPGMRGAVDSGDENDQLFKAFAAQQGWDYDNDFDWLYVDGAGVAQILTDQADFVMDWISNLPEWWLLDPPIEPTSVWIGRELDVYGNGIITRPEILETNPELAQKVARASVRGYQYVINGGQAAHEEAVEALLKYNPELLEQPNAEEFHLANTQLFLTMMTTEEVRDNGLGYFIPEKTERTLDFINEYLLEEPLALEDAFSPVIEENEVTIDYDAALASLETVAGRPNPLFDA
ncbi:MAG TPA: ABC transporter substrate-binding protein [Acidimicrobiia bacterium]|jgi:NitT/TauT family transport system substrate-binding protein